MNGAGADDDEKAVILAQDDIGGVAAAIDDGLEGGLRHGNLGRKKRRGDQRILAKNYVEHTCG